VALLDGHPEVALGSAGSNRIRSAILQTIVGVIDGGLPAQAAVDAPRIHVENDLIDAEPGVDPDALAMLTDAGWKLRQWDEPNLYFGGVQAVALDRDAGRLSGGGDARRGGVVVSVE
jgi:gamma-glutamyltranspeptidase / glutathione hydrolase